MKFRFLIVAAILMLACVVQAQAAEDETSQAAEKKSHSRIIIYPILWQVPLYGAEVDLPSVPDGGNGGGGGNAISRSTEYGLDSAFLAGITVEREKWFVDLEGTYAALSGERERPLFKVSSDVYFFSATGGWRFYKDLAITGGFKYVSMDIQASLGDELSARTKPDLWDPMIGVDWRSFVTDKLQLSASFEGGGFGVGTDTDLSGNVEADYEIIPHVILNAGYGFVHLKVKVPDVKVGNLERDFELSQTLYGPRVGLGFRF